MTGGRDEVHRCRGESGGLVRKLGLLIALVLAAVAGAAYAGWLPDIDSGAERERQGDPALADPPVVVPGLDLRTPPTAAPVLTSAVGRPVTAAALGAAVQAGLEDRSLGRSVGFMVQDLGDPAVSWRFGERLVTPASTLKLLTAATALELLGPEHRFRTTVVAGAGLRRILLVGGGDPLLTDERPDRSAHPTPATLAELADRTAAALRRDGVRRVRLDYDTSLFSGPSVSPAWEPSYLPDNVVSPIVPLWVDEGREVAGYALRSADPALVATQRFARLLAEQGIKVVGTPTDSRPPAGARELAAVESPPLETIVQHVLEVSDNEGAEVLLRHAALAAGRPGSFTAGARVVRSTLGGLGVDLTGARLYDGSGLARGNLLPVKALIEVLALSAHPEQADLRPVISTLPVAGFTGSLAYRFVDVATGGLGTVRAKTGTLTGVHGLAGMVVTRGGRPLVFAAVADRVPVPRTLDARAQLDTLAALLATCTCS